MASLIGEFLVIDLKWCLGLPWTRWPSIQSPSMTSIKGVISLISTWYMRWYKKMHCMCASKDYSNKHAPHSDVVHNAYRRLGILYSSSEVVCLRHGVHYWSHIYEVFRTRAKWEKDFNCRVNRFSLMNNPLTTKKVVFFSKVSSFKKLINCIIDGTYALLIWKE